MKNATIFLSVTLVSLADLGLNILTIYLATKGSLSQQISEYSFGKSLIDLSLLCYLRICFAIGELFGILRGKNEGVKRLQGLKRTIVNTSVGLCLLIAVKLLYFAEDSKEVLENSAAIKILFVTSALSNCTVYLQWSLLINLKFFPISNANCTINIDKEQGTEEERDSLLSGSSDEASSSGSESEESGDEDSHQKENGGKKKKKKGTANSTIWKLIKFAKPDIPYLLLGFLFLLIASICEIFLPYFSGQVISAIAIYKSYDMFKRYIILMTTVSLAASIATGLRGGTFTYVMARFTIRLQNFLLEHILKQEIGFFDTKKTGSIISRLTSDTTKMGDQIALNVNVFLRNIVKIIGILIFMAKLSWKLTIVTIVGTPIIVMLSEAYGEYYEKLSKKVQDSLALANEAAEESISSIRTVRSFAAEKIETKRYHLRLQDTFRLKVKEAIAFGGYLWCTEICFLAIEVLILFYGGHLVMRGDLSGGNLVAFSFYSFDLSGCIEDIGDIYTSLMEAVGASHKVFAYLEREPKIENDGTLKPTDFKGSIEFQNVSFSYPSRSDIPVLENISFRVDPGEIIALVGPSGGGKSTVVKLLEHFYEAQIGKVLVDCVPVQNYDHEYIHNRMALVAQEPTLFARTIAENITYGMENIDDERIKAVAEQSNAHEFITTMPEGYQTQTGEKGVQLSGGQKQRVAIARALIRNPSVLILDEATSALDADSEFMVQEAINKNLADRTVIIVAHRLSTIEVADKILVIDKGQVMEKGTHSDLIDKDGIYARLVMKQLHGNGKHRPNSRGATSLRKDNDGADDDGGDDASNCSGSESSSSESFKGSHHNSPPKSFKYSRSFSRS
eukprot:Seg2586.4 transcript_id=Seg2586.4/GoldUCD/mRNA.D3Y31 product="ATP-binding cassette sub-family B member 9" protein_id=Seg2586.4/GoldUCD/D3Y31